MCGTSTSYGVHKQVSRLMFCIVSCSFFDILDQIAQPGYIPSEEDVIRVRIQTTGIFESLFEVGPMMFQYVGGRMRC